jgi:hypothetical protein
MLLRLTSAGQGKTESEGEEQTVRAFSGAAKN